MLAEYLSKKRIACYVSTATEYGKSLLQEEQLSDIIILAGRMNEEEIKTFLTEKKLIVLLMRPIHLQKLSRKIS